MTGHTLAQVAQRLAIAVHCLNILSMRHKYEQMYIRYVLYESVNAIYAMPLSMCCAHVVGPDPAADPFVTCDLEQLQP